MLRLVVGIGDALGVADDADAVAVDDADVVVDDDGV